MKSNILLSPVLSDTGGIMHAQSTGSSIIESSISISEDLKLDYAEKGDENGTPLIFLHGFTDSWHSFEKVLPQLPGNIHAFAITQRGHGNSSKPQSNYEPKDFAADVAAFIKIKNLGPTIIVGHSMGGAIAQRFALDYPSLLKALVIVDSDAAFKNNADVKSFLTEVLNLTDPITYEFADAFQASTIVHPIDSNYYKQLVTESTKVPAHVWKKALTALTKVDYTDELKNIQKPTLIIWGDEDSYCSRESQQRLLNGIQNSKLVVYKATGHALHWEKPEQFAADITAFANSIN